MDQQAIEGMRNACDLLRRSRRRTDHRLAAKRTRLFQVLKAVFDVGGEELRAVTRGRCHIAFARQTGMYLARVALGATLFDAGRLFGRDRTTASHACRIVEDLRDDPGFDALLHAMEAFVTHPEPRTGRARQ